jgi:Skp family chaperone for outer membrane proteins
MSALSNKVDAIQGLGSKLNGALRESQKTVEANKFFLSSGNAKLAKYAFWAAAGAGLATGVMLAPAAPAVAAIGFGVSVGVGVIGSALEKIAGEREHLRQEHQQFMAQAKDFMKVLQKAYVDVKQEMQEEQRTGRAYQNADFVQYQQHRQEQQLSQHLDAGNSISAPVAEGVANKVSAGMRLG